MSDNIQWLWYAFGMGWLIHMVYLYSISNREARIEKEIRDLERLLANQAEKHSSRQSQSR